MLKRILNKLLRIGGISLQLAKKEELEFFRDLDNCSLLYSQLNQSQRELISPFLPFSKSQLAQDLFALAFSDSKEPKYFVEFGATDGVTGSNTWLLEKELGWKGILAEPARCWHENLYTNRKCNIETKCIAKQSGLILDFLEVGNKNGGSPTLSSLEEYSNNKDWASKIRKKDFIKYQVETISLLDLLKKHNAPHEIQFLSIDTEGSEFDIIKSFDFREFKIKTICVEHNYVERTRTLINNYLYEKGYKNILKEVSKYDDWYLLDS